MAQIKLFGYCDKLSVKPGDDIAFHVTADGTSEAEAQLVKLVHGDQHPDGPGFIEREVDCEANGTWAVEKQFTQVGSFLTVDDPQALPINGVQNWQSGFLPPIYQGTRFRSTGAPVLNLRPDFPQPRAIETLERDLIARLDRIHRRRRQRPCRGLFDRGRRFPARRHGLRHPWRGEL